MEETLSSNSCEGCDESLPDEAMEAIRLFNAGDYYHQHDRLEVLWRAEPRRVRDLYQGILQIGIAYFQAGRGNGRGAMKMALRAERWLSGLPNDCQGVDVKTLRADGERLRAALIVARLDTAQIDPGLFRPVPMMTSPPDPLSNV